jgi:hypothetical protein
VDLVDGHHRRDHVLGVVVLDLVDGVPEVTLLDVPRNARIFLLESLTFRLTLQHSVSTGV